MVTLKEKNRNINTANQSTGELGLCCCPVTQGTLQHPQGMGRVCIPGTQLASLAGWTRVGAVHSVTAWGNVTICSSHPKPFQVPGREHLAGGTGGFSVTLLSFKAEAGILKSPGGAPTHQPQNE